VATEFDEIFSGYQPRRVSVSNRRFDGHLGRSLMIMMMMTDMVLGSMQTPDAADGPKRFHRMVIMLAGWKTLNTQNNSPTIDLSEEEEEEEEEEDLDDR
jgi:hypothetical protein